MLLQKGGGILNMWADNTFTCKTNKPSSKYSGFFALTISDNPYTRSSTSKLKYIDACGVFTYRICRNIFFGVLLLFFFQQI